ncbi:hypothetical protein D3C72_2195610 [compost metagenome]
MVTSLRVFGDVCAQDVAAVRFLARVAARRSSRRGATACPWPCAKDMARPLPRLIRGTHRELVDRGVLGLINREGHNTGDPIRGNSIGVVNALHLVKRRFVRERLE